MPETIARLSNCGRFEDGGGNATTPQGVHLETGHFADGARYKPSGHLGQCITNSPHRFELGGQASEALGEKPGTIRVTTSQVKVDPDLDMKDVTGLPVGRYLRLEVSDTGCGMSWTRSELHLSYAGPEIRTLENRDHRVNTPPVSDLTDYQRLFCWYFKLLLKFERI
jgi:hypothetical protein